VAAPTAGLHFTPELLKRLRDTGITQIDITLHVGQGTFKPVTAPSLDAHPMHEERYEVSAEAVKALRRVRGGGDRVPTGRVIAVGTTSVRTLESLPDFSLPWNAQMYGPFAGMTDLLIAPPYEFRHVDGMLTNFHLPRSTLLALVAAMVGLDRVHEIYAEAIARGYRFYSYGDAMLILP
jgi:S-adenosylmethionine:tRNA ribosyltransferase-isomerase